MDFPRSVPNIGLVAGKFVDENAVSGQPGSLIPSEWGNSVTLELINVFLAAGIAPDEFKTDQLATAIAAIVHPKADRATTLGGYGIVDAYTRTDINYFLDRKADSATSLSGYRIAIATQLEAEEGSENTKPTTALRVFQAIAAKVKQATASLAGIVMLANQVEAEAGEENSKAMTALRVAQSIAKRVVGATESVVGISRFATLGEVVAGAAGAIAVSPSYMIFGLSYSFGLSGYIKLPSFLGGFMLQWAHTDESNSLADERFFPTPFPGEIYGAWLQLNSGTAGGLGSNFNTVIQVLSPSKYVWNAAGSFGGGGKAYMIAIGR